MNFIFLVFNPPSAFSCGFPCLWGGEHVFVHVFTAASRGGFEEKLKGGFKGGFRGA